MSELSNDLTPPKGGGTVRRKIVDDSSGVIVATAQDVGKPQPLGHWIGSLARQDPDSPYFLIPGSANVGAVYIGPLSGMNPAAPANGTNPPMQQGPTNVTAGQSDITYLMFANAGDTNLVTRGSQASGATLGPVLAQILAELQAIEATLTAGVSPNSAPEETPVFFNDGATYLEGSAGAGVAKQYTVPSGFYAVVSALIISIAGGQTASISISVGFNAILAYEFSYAGTGVNQAVGPGLPLPAGVTTTSGSLGLPAPTILNPNSQINLVTSAAATWVIALVLVKTLTPG